MDFIRDEAESDVLAMAGLREEEDMFAYGLEVDAEPLGLARDQSGDRLHRLARDRRIRRLDRENWSRWRR